jgi:hypothetical protein
MHLCSQLLTGSFVIKRAVTISEAVLECLNARLTGGSEINHKTLQFIVSPDRCAPRILRWGVRADPEAIYNLYLILKMTL